MKGYRMRAKPPRADGRPTSCGGSARRDADRLRGIARSERCSLALAGGSLRPVFQLGRGGSTPVGPGE